MWGTAQGCRKQLRSIDWSYSVGCVANSIELLVIGHSLLRNIGWAAA